VTRMSTHHVTRHLQFLAFPVMLPLSRFICHRLIFIINVAVAAGALTTHILFVQYSIKHRHTMQSVLHSAARLIMRKRKFDSITPTTDNQRCPSLASSAAENRLRAQHDHLQVLASDCSGVPSRHVRASLDHCQSSLPAFSCSWWLTSLGDQNCYFRDPQLCVECPQTLKQPTTATPRFDTDT